MFGIFMDVLNQQFEDDEYDVEDIDDDMDAMQDYLGLVIVDDEVQIAVKFYVSNLKKFKGIYVQQLQKHIGLAMYSDYVLEQLLINSIYYLDRDISELI